MRNSKGIPQCRTNHLYLKNFFSATLKERNMLDSYTNIRSCEGLNVEHSFQDCLKPLWNYVIEVQTTAHFLLHCPKPFWTASNLFFLIFWNKVTLLLIMFFSLVIPV